MIWHIFRKDWKLMWGMVVAGAVLNAIPRVILTSLRGIGSPRFSALAALSTLLAIVAVMVTAVLIVVAVQQDPIAGVRQDWLVRPIRRRDLLLSKLLFIVLAVQGPILIFEIGQGLAGGFSLGESIGAPLSRALWMLLAFDIPLAAFATLTRNFAEAVGAGVVVVLGGGFFMSTATSMNPFLTFHGAITWVTDCVQLAWLLIGAAVVLAMQYFRRKTTGARWVFCCATLLWLVSQLMPWQPAFAIQERFSPQPAAASAIRIAFDPGSRRLKRGPGASEPRWYKVAPDDVLTFIPLNISGADDGRTLVADRATMRLTEPGGKVIELAAAPPSNSPGNLALYQPAWIPAAIYNVVKDRSARLEIDYSLTLLHENPLQTMPALNGDQRVPGVGWCVTRKNQGNTEIALNCLVPGKPPCASWLLEDAKPGGGIANAERDGCSLDYSPWFGRVEGDSMSRFGTSFRFRDPAGLIRYSINESQLSDARILIRTYRPLAHFTRQVVIPDIRLSDWRPE